MKKKVLFISIFLLLVLLLRFVPFKVHYTIYATGKVFSLSEWTLGRTTDGRIISTLKNNEFDQISNYGGREFLRGDLFDFTVDPLFSEKNYIQKGDLIARLYSNEIGYQLTKLEADLAVEEANYNVFATGEKPEVIKEAEENKKLAIEKYDIQKKLFDRKLKLYRDSLISRQDYEMAQNGLEVCKIGVELSQAQLLKLNSGDKKQQLEYVQSKIAALQTQISLLKKRMEQFEVRAPFGGMLQHKKGALSTVDVIANILDTSTYVIITPVQYKEIPYMQVGCPTEFQMFHTNNFMTGKVTRVDNVIQVVGGRQSVYVTSRIDKKLNGVLPGLLTQTSIDCGEITLWDYFKRVMSSTIRR
jgi:hypothetical protein